MQVQHKVASSGEDATAGLQDSERSHPTLSVPGLYPQEARSGSPRTHLGCQAYFCSPKRYVLRWNHQVLTQTKKNP